MRTTHLVQTVVLKRKRLSPGEQIPAATASGVLWSRGDGGAHAPHGGTIVPGVRGSWRRDWSFSQRRATRRGTGPLLSALGAIVLLGERPTLQGLAGLIAVVAGILLIATQGDLAAFRRPGGRAGIA